MGMIRGVAAVAEVTRRGNRGGDCGVVNCGVNSDDDEGQQRIILSTPKTHTFSR